MIELPNAHVKNVVMENVTQLGSAKDKFKGVTISHDITIKEREQCRISNSKEIGGQIVQHIHIITYGSTFLTIE